MLPGSSHSPFVCTMEKTVEMDYLYICVSPTAYLLYDTIARAAEIRVVESTKASKNFICREDGFSVTYNYSSMVV